MNIRGRSLKQQHTAVVKIYLLVYHYHLQKEQTILRSVRQITALRAVKTQNGDIRPQSNHAYSQPLTPQGETNAEI